jgi:hypothetical protein
MKREIAIAIVIGLITLVAVIVTEVSANQPLSNDDLKQQLTNLDSFASETLLIIDQYSQDKLSFIYVKNQIEQIDKNVNDFYSLVESKPIPDDQQNNVNAVEKLVTQFSSQLKRIASADADKAKLSEVQPIIKQLREQFSESELQYE